MKTLKSGNAIIHISATGDDDYVARTKDITVTVEKRKISVITNNKSMTVNGMIPTFDVTTVGNFAGSDTDDTVFERTGFVKLL
ncbi:MAG: hypothetical protein MR413_07560 [Clostridia bacterium]|nr:hypothetical protein [Clostridia bacterium]